jgi:hypothetical protein
MSGLMLFSAVACGNDRDGRADPGPPSRGTPSRSAIAVDQHPIPTATAAGAAQIPLSWRLLRIDGRQNRIYLDISSRNCSSPQAVVVAESATSITLTALGSKPPSGACAGEKKTVAGYVTLRDPVGNPAVQHGAP